MAERLTSRFLRRPLVIPVVRSARPVCLRPVSLTMASNQVNSVCVGGADDIVARTTSHKNARSRWNGGSRKDAEREINGGTSFLYDRVCALSSEANEVVCQVPRARAPPKNI